MFGLTFWVSPNMRVKSLISIRKLTYFDFQVTDSGNYQAKLIFALSNNTIEAIYGRQEVNPDLLNENQNDSTC
jgi:hypothetical protein